MNARKLLVLLPAAAAVALLLVLAIGARRSPEPEARAPRNASPGTARWPEASERAAPELRRGDPPASEGSHDYAPRPMPPAEFRGERSPEPIPPPSDAPPEEIARAMDVNWTRTLLQSYRNALAGDRPDVAGRLRPSLMERKSVALRLAREGLAGAADADDRDVARKVLESLER